MTRRVISETSSKHDLAKVVSIARAVPAFAHPEAPTL